MSGFCSGRCSRFPRCTLFLYLPLLKAASSAGASRGLLSFGALLTCLERLFFIILDKLIARDCILCYFLVGVEMNFEAMGWVVI